MNIMYLKLGRRNLRNLRRIVRNFVQSFVVIHMETYMRREITQVRQQGWMPMIRTKNDLLYVTTILSKTKHKRLS
jgi:hypothetical protein